MGLLVVDLSQTTNLYARESNFSRSTFALNVLTSFKSADFGRIGGALQIIYAARTLISRAILEGLRRSLKRK